MPPAISNVVHITSWLSHQGGGIPPVVWSLAGQMQRSGIDCCVAGLQDQWSGQEVPGSIRVVTGAIKGPPFFGFSPGLSDQVRALVNQNSVVHAHGLWMHPGVVARQSARRTGCPLVISPHGMLEPWALQNSSGKKRVAAWLFENENLHSADCLHALCSAEAKNFRGYGLRKPIAIIPNGVDLPAPDPRGTNREDVRQKSGVEGSKKNLLFLSRLHPKKGLENLLIAWRAIAARFPSWNLIIAGSGATEYENSLRTLAANYALQTRVAFVGSVYGKEKDQLLAAAAAFVLPSFSEGFSMAVLEAAAAGLPVVLTHECNFPELAAVGGAFAVAPEVSAIEAGLRELLTLPDGKRIQMGQRGRELVQQSYTWPAVASQMVSVYRWLAAGAPRPDCVSMD